MKIHELSDKNRKRAYEVCRKHYLVSPKRYIGDKKVTALLREIRGIIGWFHTCYSIKPGLRELHDDISKELDDYNLREDGMERCIECKNWTFNYIKCEGGTTISPLAVSSHTGEIYEDESVEGDYEPQDGEIRCLECAFEYEYREREKVWSRDQSVLLKKYKAQLDNNNRAL